ncbi:hypothetical protein [Massilia orientalis]|uniref:Uncharacterized protein n=1 Tax=Massilia orientalis TaxID=3050128 RepID=A0ACC7M6N0_9BURK|nr:hypothetical protein [Massilia sp. YIM B02787]
MSMLSTIPATTGTDRIAGIDVAKLLRDIGEASANDSSTALFGLLLSAQQVLTQVQASSPTIRTPREDALSATYHAMNDNGQDRLVSYARHLQKRFSRQRATLTLVPTSSQEGAR